MQGHEGELLDQLTGGLVVPAGGEAEDGAEGAAAAAAGPEQREESAPRPVSKGMRSQTILGAGKQMNAFKHRQRKCFCTRKQIWPGPAL